MSPTPAYWGTIRPCLWSLRPLVTGLILLAHEAVCAVASGYRPTANTSSGIVQGLLSGCTHIFRGIPFAKAPVGDLRWRPPQKHPGWDSPLDASDFGPTCWQSVLTFGGSRRGMWNSINVSRMSEDCLYLNVYAPACIVGTPGCTNTPSARLPVMIYLHAGEMQYGSSNDAENNFPYFSDKVVLVTPNSRIGALGFLGADILRSRAPNGGTGNYGMLDQRLALQWVQENIAAFGGDPERVTIWGESSGGTNVAYHLVSPLSWPYYQRAILQSPGIRQVMRWDNAHENYEFFVSALALLGSPNCSVQPGLYSQLVGAKLASAPVRTAANESLKTSYRWCDLHSTCVGFSVDPRVRLTYFYSGSEAIINIETLMPGTYGRSSSGVVSHLKAGPIGEAALRCLLSADASHFINFNVPQGDTLDTDSWGPVIDGVDLHTTIEHSIGTGAVAPGVDVLLGTNLDEDSTFLSLLGDISCRAGPDDFQRWALNTYGSDLGSKIPDLYQELREPVPSLKCHDRADRDTPAGYWLAAAMRTSTDASFQCPVRELARSLAGRANPGHTFKYFFAHTPAMSVNYRTTADIGAFHGADVAFAFFDSFELLTPADRALAAAMACYWASFAASGRPNSNKTGCQQHLPLWPEYSMQDEVSLELVATGNTSATGNATLLLRPLKQFQEAQCDLFAGYLADPPAKGPQPSLQLHAVAEVLV